MTEPREPQDLPEDWLRDVVAHAVREIESWPKWKQPVIVRKTTVNRRTDHG